MTTMDRLFKKGLLARRKVGRAFVYAATATRDEMEGAVATELVQSLLQRHGSEPLPILSSLVDAVSDRDRALLDELERLIREKRRASDRRGADDASFLLHGATLALAWFLLRQRWRDTVAVALASSLVDAAIAPGSPASGSPCACLPAAASIVRRRRLPAVVLAVRAARRRRRLRRHADRAGAARARHARDRGRRARRGRVARRVAAHARWMRRASAGARRHAMPAFAIDADAPVMALVGVLRPRLLITRRCIDALTDEELAASVAHELGHWRALGQPQAAGDARRARLSAGDTAPRERSSGDGRRPPSMRSPIAMAAGRQRGARAARSRRRWSRSRA